MKGMINLDYFKKEERHFRIKRSKFKDIKPNRPGLIVGSTNTKPKKVAYIPLSTKYKKGKHKNYELEYNPNPRSNKKSYLVNNILVVPDKEFRKIKKNWKLSDKDQIYVDKLIFKKINKNK